MPLYSPKEALNLKLNCVPLPQLKILARMLGVSESGSAASIIKRMLEGNPKKETIDNFIKERYAEKIQQRRTIISDEDLGKELLKVKTFSWGVVQGQLDQKYKIAM